MDGSYLLLIVLLKEEYLEDVVLALTENGATGAVVLDGMNLQTMLAYQIPIFAGFREELGAQPGYAKVLLSHVSDTGFPDRIVQALRESGTDFQKDELGRMMLMPLTRYIDPSTPRDGG